MGQYMAWPGDPISMNLTPHFLCCIVCLLVVTSIARSSAFREAVPSSPSFKVIHPWEGPWCGCHQFSACTPLQSQPAHEPISGSLSSISWSQGIPIQPEERNEGEVRIQQCRVPCGSGLPSHANYLCPLVLFALDPSVPFPLCDGFFLGVTSFMSSWV